VIAADFHTRTEVHATGKGNNSQKKDAKVTPVRAAPPPKK
jgi:hypothetical protein